MESGEFDLVHDTYTTKQSDANFIFRIQNFCIKPSTLKKKINFNQKKTETNKYKDFINFGSNLLNFIKTLKICNMASVLKQ